MEHKLKYKTKDNTTFKKIKQEEISSESRLGIEISYLIAKP